MSSGIPAASRKMVQSLKEIVKDSTDLEIYSTLTDCNMDPNEAVNRLLSQGEPNSTQHNIFYFYLCNQLIYIFCLFSLLHIIDPFHEVKKTKRDKKKDTSSTTRARPPARKTLSSKKEHQNGTPPPYHNHLNTQLR